MQPSLILCRTQEAHHHARSQAAVLDNVRLIADMAAAAWAKEGEAAELRENRKLRTQAFAEPHRPNHATPHDLRSLSENPDRGYATEA